MESLVKQKTLPEVIRSEAEYNALKSDLDRMHDAYAAGNMNQYDDDYFRAIVVLLRSYHSQDAVGTILSYMEANGLRQKDIAPLLGGQNRASEVLSRKRPLTVKMIRALHDNLGISYDDLMRESVR